MHNSEGAPELSHLHGLKFEIGDRPGMADVIHINKLRAKRAFEATLPPLSDVAMLPMRQKMMEDWEEKEWKEREDEIESKQVERLELLQEAIVAREMEVEAAHAQRVQSTTDNLLQAKQRAFSIIQKNRIRGIRHFMEARKCDITQLMPFTAALETADAMTGHTSAVACMPCGCSQQQWIAWPQQSSLRGHMAQVCGQELVAAAEGGVHHRCVRASRLPSVCPTAA